MYTMILAALHLMKMNQAETKARQKSFSISFPKHKQGGHTVRKLNCTPTYRK